MLNSITTPARTNTSTTIIDITLTLDNISLVNGNKSTSGEHIVEISKKIIEKFMIKNKNL